MQENGDGFSYAGERRRVLSALRKLWGGQPELQEGWGKLHGAGMKSGVLDTKTKELIALAIGVAARCEGCLAFHTRAALQAGASEEEIQETLGVAVVMGGGPSLMTAAHVIDAMEEFREKQPAS